MFRKVTLAGITIALLGAVGSAVSAGEVSYVQPFKAKIFAKPSMASEVIGQIDSGYQFEATGKEGSWVKFSYQGKTGYIPAVQAARTPPLGKGSVQADQPKLGARARTSSASAVVAGMKGLTYEDRARITKGERSDYESLDKIDQLKITEAELQQFQLEGGKP